MRIGKKQVLIISVFCALLLLGGAFVLWNGKDIYISEITIEKSYEDVWAWVSDPMKYESLYPHWIKRVTSSTEGIFHVDDQFGHSYEMTVILSKEHGIIDLLIGPESSRSRIYKLDDKRTAIVHFARRWSSANPVPWFFHKITTCRDFRNAKRVIEGN